MYFVGAGDLWVFDIAIEKLIASHNNILPIPVLGIPTLLYKNRMIIFGGDYYHDYVMGYEVATPILQIVDLPYQSIDKFHAGMR